MDTTDWMNRLPDELIAHILSCNKPKTFLDLKATAVNGLT